MVAKPSMTRFTAVGLLVLIAVVGMGVAMLLPIMNWHREAARRLACQNKVHEMGVAFEGYSRSYNNAYPPAAEAIQENSTTNKIGGYSFLVKLLPFMNEEAIYDVMPRSLGSDGKVVRPHEDAVPQDPLGCAIITVMKEFICPSYGGQLYNLNTGSQQQGITNYKAMGASCKQSLAFAQYVSPASNSGAVPYGTAAIHPDGAIYPSPKNLPAAQILDGLSHTIFLCETTDSTASCWVIGSECVVTGLPGSGSNSQGTPCSVPTGTMPAALYNYFTPAHYDDTWGDSSGVTHRHADFLDVRL